MKLLPTVTSVALLALLGCTSHAVPSQAPSDASRQEAPAPALPDAGDDDPSVPMLSIDRDGYHIDVPASWHEDASKETTDPASGTRTSLDATSPRPVGSIPMLLTVEVLALSPKDTAATFPVSLSMQLQGMLKEGGLDSELQGRRLQDINGTHESLTALIVPEKGVGVTVIAAAHERTGYVLTCLGDVLHEEDAVVKACVDVMTSFRLTDGN